MTLCDPCIFPSRSARVCRRLVRQVGIFGASAMGTCACVAASVAARRNRARSPAPEPASPEKRAEKLQAAKAAQRDADAKKGACARVVGKVLRFLDQTWLQTLQYIVFLVAFQSLTGTIRNPSEVAALHLPRARCHVTTLRHRCTAAPHAHTRPCPRSTVLLRQAPDGHLHREHVRLGAQPLREHPPRLRHLGMVA
jgi:hypothetical protein